MPALREKHVSLPPFKKVAKCPKCEETEIRTEHVDARMIGGNWKYKRLTEKEYMERRCVECDWRWPEAPRDSLPKRKGKAK